LKLTLNAKIILWFIIIILISLVLYGTMIFLLFRFNLYPERQLEILKQNPGGGDIMRIENFEKMIKSRGPEIFAPFTVLPPHLVWRIFYLLTGGILAIIIISTSGGFLFLRRSLNQINYITNNVKEIDEKKLHLRLNLKGNDAIAKMSSTFDLMLDKIESSFKSQKQFIQNASHELNTPLTIMKTNIDVLKQNKNAAKKDYMETLELVNDEIGRLSKVTDDLLILSSLDSAYKQKLFRQIDIKKVTEKVLLIFKNKIKSKNSILLKNFKGKFVILGNEELIEVLIFNLIDNAIKYSDQNEELRIIINNDIENRNLLFEIKNKSHIIQKKDVPYLFDRFFKVRNGKTGEAQGYGLGLSICKKIVENHNGKISVDFNDLEKIISFKVTLSLYKS
jgi:two-component system, OmpR family, sensor histidine kinase ArlS